MNLPPLPEPVYSDPWATIYHGETLFLVPQLEPFDLLLTDPPYSSGGAMRSDRTQVTTAKYVQTSTTAYRPEFGGDNRDQRSYLAWCSLWLAACLQKAKPGAVCAIFTDWRQLPVTTDALQAGGWVWRGIGAWDKSEGVRPLLGGLRAQCEFVVWGTAGPREPDRNPVALPGVFRKTGVGKDRIHIAQKPEEVLRWLVQLAPPGGLVLDPFVGSGTTLRAAKDLGRRSIGIDQDGRYCAAAAERLRQEGLFSASTADAAEDIPLFELDPEPAEEA